MDTFNFWSVVFSWREFSYIAFEESRSTSIVWFRDDLFTNNFVAAISFRRGG